MGYSLNKDPEWVDDTRNRGTWVDITLTAPDGRKKSERFLVAAWNNDTPEKHRADVVAQILERSRAFEASGSPVSMENLAADIKRDLEDTDPKNSGS